MNQENENNLRLQKLQLVRNELLEEAFTKYHDLTAFLKKLPIPQQTTTMQHALLSIDTGMLWVKELINASPLVFLQPQEKKSEDTLSEGKEPKQEENNPA